MQYRPDLDGLRAVAVTLVLLFHATIPLDGAFLGVDIFFTLSGFLITTLITTALREKTFSLSSFYIRRSLRLIPASATVTTIAALTALALLPLKEACQTVLSAIAANASVSNIRYLLQSGYFDSDAITKPLLHTWSLAVEEQFYLVWPPLLLLFHRHLHPRAPFIFASIVVIISPLISSILIRSHPEAAFYLAPARFYELLIGAALSYIPPPSNSFFSQVLGIVGSIGLFLSVRLVSSTDDFPSWRALAPCISTAFLIHAGPHSFVSEVLSLQPLVFVGKISYSVYLVHWPIVVFYRLLTGQEDAFRIGEQLFMLGAAFLLGLALNVLVERRFRVAAHATAAGNNEACQGLEVESQKPTTNSSAQNCRKLFILIAFLQVVLMLAAGFTEKFKGHIKAPVTDEEGLHALRTESASHDDYNSVNITSMLQLVSEVSAARFGRLDKPNVPGYSKQGYYENGSVPERKLPGKPVTPGVSRILIIGDSHAEHFRHLAYHLSKEFNVHVQAWNAPGCVFLLGVHNLFLLAKDRTALCRKAIMLWKEQILAERFDTVVVCGRWAWHVEMDTYGNRAIETMGHLLFDESVPPEKRKLSKDPSAWLAQVEESRRLFRKSVQETVKFLTGTGARVVLMGQVPLLTSNPSGCTSYPASQKAIAAGRQPDRCAAVTREKAFSRMRYVREVFEEVRRMQWENVSTLHPTDMFCDNYLQDKEKCRVVFRDSILYRDQSHINKFGSSYFAMRLKALGYGGVPWNFVNLLNKK